METSEQVGAVKMKTLYALKRICEEYSFPKLIGGGVLKRFETIMSKTYKEKDEAIKTNDETTKTNIEDNSMFGHDILEELGIKQTTTGEYVKEETQEESIR